MTIATSYIPVEFPITDSGPYEFSYRVLEGDDIVVSIDNVVILPTEYTVTLNPDQENNPGGSVLFIAPPVGDFVIISRNTDPDQQVEFLPYSPFPAATVEFTLDKLTMLVQELREGQINLDGYDVTVDDDDWVRLVGEDVQTAFDSTDFHINFLYSIVEDPDLPFNNLVAAILWLYANKVSIDGSIAMTGPLTLSGDATNPLHAVPLQQMEAADQLVLDTALGAITDIGSNTINTVSSDVLLMAADIAGPLVEFLPLSTPEIFLAVRHQNNSSAPNALVQLDATGLIPVELLPFDGFALVGFWDPIVDGPIPPATGVTAGDIIAFIADGDMTLLEPGNQVPHTVPVTAGDRMVWLEGLAPDFADGWYYSAQTIVDTLPASNVTFDNTGTGFVGVTVQAVLEEIDIGFARLSGATFTGDVAIKTNAPTAEMSVVSAGGGLSILASDSGWSRIYETDPTGARLDSWMHFSNGGGVTLSAGGANRLQTTSIGVLVFGDLKAQVTGNNPVDISAWNDLNGGYGITAKADGATWFNELDNTGTYTQSFIRVIKGAGVHLFYDGVNVLNTDANLVNINGNLNIQGQSTDTIYKANTPVGQVAFGGFKSTGHGFIHQYSSTGVSEGNWARFIRGGGVELFNNGAKKFNTQPNGVDVAGSVFADGFASDVNLYLGNDTGSVKINIAIADGAFNITQNAPNNGAYEKTWAIFNRDGRIDLYHNNIKVFQTDAAGVVVTGQARVTAAAPIAADDLTRKDYVDSVAGGGGAGTELWSGAVGIGGFANLSQPFTDFAAVQVTVSGLTPGANRSSQTWVLGSIAVGESIDFVIGAGSDQLSAKINTASQLEVIDESSGRLVSVWGVG